MINLDLFAGEDTEAHLPREEWLGQQAVVLRQFVLADADMILQSIQLILQTSPFRQMKTAGGYQMSVQLSSFGQLGWVSDEQGYAYRAMDPYTQQPWPAIPDGLKQLAQRAAAQAGFANFMPDSCLINRYEIDSKMSLHQDKNEIDFTQPIVSMSLGIPAIFLFGGFSRQAITQRVWLQHGDVVVWGGVDRMRFHGVMPVKAAWHDRLGATRINLTFRRAG